MYNTLTNSQNCTLESGSPLQFMSDQPAQSTQAEQNNDAHIRATKTLRRDIQVQVDNLQKEQYSRQSHPRSQAEIKLMEAKMWLGKDLEELGTPNPYPLSTDPTSTIVHSPTDMAPCGGLAA